MNKFRSFSDCFQGFFENVCGGKGFASTRVLTFWGSIVGENLAKQCLPVRVDYPKSAGNTNGKLIIAADNGPISTELHHMQPEIIQNVNAFFGYRAVASVKIIQTLQRICDDEEKLFFKQEKPQKKHKMCYDSAEIEQLNTEIEEVDSSELRDALWDIVANALGKDTR
jgi:hypothetical protein